LFLVSPRLSGEESNGFLMKCQMGLDFKLRTVTFPENIAWLVWSYDHNIYIASYNIHSIDLCYLLCQSSSFCGMQLLGYPLFVAN
jgi:hypothetical protein